MRLEPELWDALEEICARERVTMGEIVRRVEGTLGRANDPGGRTSAVRVYVLRYFREAATPAGHAAAGNGAIPTDLPAVGTVDSGGRSSLAAHVSLAER